MSQQEEGSVVEIKARWQKTIYKAESNGYTVAVFRALEGGFAFHAIGTALPDTPIRVKLSGAFEKSKYGRQFAVAYYEILPPDTRSEFVSFVSTLGCRFGQKKAGKLFDLCGPGVWDMIEQGTLPKAAYKVAKQKDFDKLREKLHETFADREILRLVDGCFNVDLADLRQRGISAREIKENPYLFCACGNTFRAIDAWAQSRSLCGPLDENRLRAAVHQVFANAAHSGNCCIPKETLLFGDKRRGIEGLLPMLDGLIDQQAAEDLISRMADKEIRLNSGFYYEAETLWQERLVTTILMRLIDNKPTDAQDCENWIKQYEAAEGIQLTQNQRDAVKGMLENRVSILTGYPGTGKTTTIKAVISVASSVGMEPSDILLLSPTGRAARRMEEATGHMASTVLSALKFTGKNTWDILHDKDPLPYRMVIVDEVSMMDLQQTAMLLRHIGPDTRLVLIGDPDQLPSVNAGNVLQDFIFSGEIPSFVLKEIFRQKSDKHENPIPRNAQKMREGRTDLVWTSNPESAFVKYPVDGDEEIFKKACKIYKKLVTSSKIGLTIDDVALLCPYRKKSGQTLLTSSQFNAVLQANLNPVGASENYITAHGINFHAGDKVMQTVNTEGPKNGDVGYIESVTVRKGDPEEGVKDEKVACINFGGGMVVEYTPKDMQNVDLAYATSVHKMQGAQIDTVILVVSNVHGPLLVRNLVYTAITRAIKHVIVVGEIDAFLNAIQKDSTRDFRRARITLLGSRIHHAATKATKKKP